MKIKVVLVQVAFFGEGFDAVRSGTAQPGARVRLMACPWLGQGLVMVWPWLGHGKVKK